MTLKERISKVPWKEFMIGEGVLSLGLGCLLLGFALTSTDLVYGFIHNLDQVQLKNLLLFGAEVVLSVGLLLIGLPFMVFSCQMLFTSKTTKEKRDEIGG